MGVGVMGVVETQCIAYLRVTVTKIRQFNQKINLGYNPIQSNDEAIAEFVKWWQQNN